MNDSSHDDIDQELKSKDPFTRLLHRCAVVELRYEYVSTWMQENDPQALDTILEETKDLGYGMKLEFQKKIGQIVRDVGGTLEL